MDLSRASDFGVPCVSICVHIWELNVVSVGHMESTCAGLWESFGFLMIVEFWVGLVLFDGECPMNRLCVKEWEEGKVLKVGVQLLLSTIAPLSHEGAPPCNVLSSSKPGHRHCGVRAATL